MRPITGGSCNRSRVETAMSDTLREGGRTTDGLRCEKLIQDTPKAG